MLKKLIKMGVVMSILLTSASAFAQDVEYPRYGFGSNWSIGGAIDYDWEMQQHGSNPVNGWRKSFNAGIDIFGQKKIHHAFDIRARLHMPTLWRGELDATNMRMARYSSLTGEIVWSLSNALHGYDPDRTWSAPYFVVGAGLGLSNVIFDRSLFGETHYGARLGHVFPTLVLGIGGKVDIAEHSSLFVEFDFNANDAPDIFKQRFDDLRWVHANARLGYMYNFGLTEADRAIASQQTMLTQENFGALNSQVSGLEQQLSDSKKDTKKLENRIAELEKQLADAMKNQGNKVNSAAADSLQRIINQIKADQLNYYAMPFSVLYAVDDWNVSETEMEKVKAVARVMKDNSDVKITVVGFADYTGSDQYNMKLSEKRANEVKRLLTKKYGIAEDRIEVDYKGKSAPFGDVQYSINRRVSFYRVIK